MNLAQEFERILRDTSTRLGVDLKENLDEVRTYIAETMLTLSLAVDEPGYDEVLRAAGVNVALMSIEKFVEGTDALDRELVGTITGALAIGARALVV